METLTTFQPPHMDVVTGLAVSRGYLISGSKDKTLRLWSLDNSIYNLKATTEQCFNDHINAVESESLSYLGDSYRPLFYVGDKMGQVKVGNVVKEKIEFIDVFSHTQSVNAICSV
jgi:WD40 repeat protein